jgi:hypothetical protein
MTFVSLMQNTGPKCVNCGMEGQTCCLDEYGIEQNVCNDGRVCTNAANSTGGVGCVLCGGYGETCCAAVDFEGPEVQCPSAGVFAPHFSMA